MKSRSAAWGISAVITLLITVAIIFIGETTFADISKSLIPSSANQTFRVAAANPTNAFTPLISMLMPIILIAGIVAGVIVFGKKKEPQKPIQKQIGQKSKWVAFVLDFLVGVLGSHRYYLGYTKQGVLQSCGFVSLIVVWCLAAGISKVSELLFMNALLIFGSFTGGWALVDLFKILFDKLLPINGAPFKEDETNTVNGSLAQAETLEKLAKLHQQGILTDEEFNQKKADLLAKM